MKLVLIRHTSVAVARGVCYGHTDVDLSPTFVEEASIVRDKLKNYRFDKIYSSPLTRCRKLAEYCGYEEFEIDPRIIEMNFGEWEMKKFDEISDPRLQEWYEDYINVAATGGESVIDQQTRLLEFIEDLKQRHPNKSTIGIFTHGGIVINALVRFGGKRFEELYGAIPDYGSITEIEITKS